MLLCAALPALTIQNKAGQKAGRPSRPWPCWVILVTGDDRQKVPVLTDACLHELSAGNGCHGTHDEEQQEHDENDVVRHHLHAAAL